MIEKYSIKSKADFRSVCQKDKITCFGKQSVKLEYLFRNPFKHKLYKLFKYIRKYEYLCYKRDSAKNHLVSKLFSFRVKLCDAKKNKLSLILKIEISPFSCGENIRICHPNVIINGYVGNGCVFHGNNVIGNKNTGDKYAIPKIGNNVDIGIGTIVIGDIEIADNCVIGAGAVVTKSFTVPGTVIAGVPAKEISQRS